MALTAQREKISLQWSKKVYEEAQKGFAPNSSQESIHGSLLILGELLRNTGEFMENKSEEVCEIVIKHRDHRSPLVQRAVITLMPSLAAFYKETFVAHFLTICMSHLIATLKKSTERAAAFQAIGEMALAVGSHIRSYVDSILQPIKEALNVKGCVFSF